MAKTVYDPAEWVRKQIEDDKTGGKDFWFNFENQDKMMLNIALQLYMNYEDEENDEQLFQECIKEAKMLLRTFYNDRFNPTTRTER